MQYSLVPGTNQLVQGYPGYNRQLFGQYGYNQINNPGWGDYYHMLQTNRGLQFADDLAQLLVKIWPKGPHATGAPATTPVITGASTSLLSPSYTPKPWASIDSVLNKSIQTDLRQSSSFSGWLSGGQWPGSGPDPLTRFKAYHELLRHAERMYYRERPEYFAVNEYLLPGQIFPVAPEYINDPQAGQQMQPHPDDLRPDNFFQAHKKLIIIAAIVVAALIVYFKVVKK
jgi:hypothetical protein